MHLQTVDVHCTVKVEVHTAQMYKVRTWYRPLQDFGHVFARFLPPPTAAYEAFASPLHLFSLTLGCPLSYKTN